MQGHFILCGLGWVGTRVLNYLRATNGKIVVVNLQPVEASVLGDDVTFIQGDCRRKEVLMQAGIDKARGILILTSDDLINLSAALLAHQLNAEARIVVRMFNPSLIPRLGQAARNITALSTSALTAPILAMVACSGQTLGAFTPCDQQKRQIVEKVIRPTSPLRDLQLAEVMKRHPVQIIGHMPRRGGYRFNNQMDMQAYLRPGDRIIFCGMPEDVARLRKREDELEQDEPLWAGLLRRYARVLARVWAEIDPPVKIFLLALIAVVAASTLVFYLSVKDLTLGTAFARTVGIMATMADLGIRELFLEEWQKIYVGMLRLAGVILIAAFTALLTNYLVRAQLKGALEMRRIPESGHIVVCGLGNVGFRVVEELLRDKENVVVIERDMQNSFIATVRRQGTAVIVGNATVAEVLKEARADTARAVVVATSNDLVNVEVGLLARELNPTQHVVLRLTDTDLALTLQAAANIRTALSIPDLAAPAFVAALFGDYMHSVFFVDGHLLAAFDLIVEDEESYLHRQSVRKLSAKHNLQIISLVHADGTTGENPLDVVLEVGACLTVIVDLADLQNMLLQEKVSLREEVEW